MTDEKRSRVLGMILGSVSRGHFPQREPVAFLYNGVRLPKLPVAEGYPYAAICPYGSDSSSYYLFLSKVPGDYIAWNEEEHYFSIDGETREYRADSYTNSFRHTETSNGISADLFAFAGYKDIIWANYNTPYLKASTPVPIYEDAPVQPNNPSGQIVAYLFNGRELPALPDWDEEKYPYAMLSAAHNGTRLYISSAPQFHKFGSGSLGVLEGTVYRRHCTYSTESGVWGEFGEESILTPTGGATTKPYWSNHNIYDDDGSLCLAASDPIPIYE